MPKPLVIYDFDGTLTPHAWTKFAILEACGLEGGGSNPEFIRRVMDTSKTHQSDTYASLWQVFFDILREHDFALSDANFARGADGLEYNPGVPEFLAKMQNSAADNIILSSSIKVFLDRTAIAPYFSDIFATTFNYDQKQLATGVDFLMNEKNKVKVIHDLLETQRGDAENATNVTYIGDGLTDFYAMDYVKNHGGHSIFVYREEKDPNLAALNKKSAVDFSVPADFTLGGPLDQLFEQQGLV